MREVAFVSGLESASWERAALSTTLAKTALFVTVQRVLSPVCQASRMPVHRGKCVGEPAVLKHAIPNRVSCQIQLVEQGCIVQRVRR